MLFVSYEFIAFLCLVVIGYYTFFKRFQWQFLLFVSFLFYYLSGKEYLIYISGVTIAVYLTAIRISKLHDGLKEKKTTLDKQGFKNEKKRVGKVQKRWFCLGLFIALVLLGIPKYTNFIIRNMNFIWSGILGKKAFNFVDLLLPLGISFYTFKSLGYLIDVFRGKYPAEKNLAKFALFVSFFPQLIQGPISRFDAISESLFEKHEFSEKKFIRGLYRLLWGYFKKVVIADRIMTAVVTIIAEPEKYNGGFAFLGIVFYTIQIYADFTGGIDITIAIAEMLGIKTEENFIRPYFSKSIKEYWNRWHITMGSWFTEYVFYPLSVSNAMLFISKSARKHLGKNIGKRVPVYISTLTVWFLTGFWHGAGWNFIVWGLLNGLFMLISEELKGFYELFHRFVPIKKCRLRIYDALCVMRTLFFVSSVRMLDCYGDVGLTFKTYFSIFTVNNWHLIGKEELGLDAVQFAVVGVGVIILFAVSLLNRGGDLRDKILAKKALLWYTGLGALFIVILVFGAYGMGFDSSQFIYNQF